MRAVPHLEKRAVVPVLFLATGSLLLLLLLTHHRACKHPREQAHMHCYRRYDKKGVSRKIPIKNNL